MLVTNVNVNFFMLNKVWSKKKEQHTDFMILFDTLEYRSIHTFKSFPHFSHKCQCNFLGVIDYYNYATQKCALL